MSNTNTNLPTQTSSVLHNDTVSSCSTSKVQEKTQLSRRGCMNSLREIQSQFKFLTYTLQDFGTMPIFKRTFAQDLDLLEQHLTKEIISQTDCKTILTKLRTTFENAFNSEFKECMQKYTRFDAQSFKDAMICNMNSIGKYMLEIILHQQRTLQLLKQKKLLQTQKDHTNPIQPLNIDSLKVDLVVIQNTCSEKEDTNSKTVSSKSVNESSLDFATKDFTLDYDSKMTDKYFVEYTRIEVKQFRDTLLQHMGNVKKSIAKRTHHQRQYDRRVNKRQMQTQESKIDTGKAVDDDLVVTKSSGTKSEVQDDNSRSGNYIDADEADIIPIYNEEPLVEIQLTAECNIFAIGQQHIEQPEINNEGRVDHYPEQCQVKSPMLDSSPNNQTTDYSKQSLESENILLKKTVAQFQKDFSRIYKTIEQTTSLLANNADLKAQIQEKVFAFAALKNDLRKLKGNSVDTKFASLVDVDPTGKLFNSCYNQDDIESTHGSNVDILNFHESKQTLISWKVYSVLCSTNMSMEKIKLFQKSFVVTAADASVKRQQQPDFTSSTSTLATTVTADGNFDL
ncbi:hypothetical protein Tco_0370914 [Tanacetum coccineum]